VERRPEGERRPLGKRRPRVRGGACGSDARRGSAERRGSDGQNGREVRRHLAPLLDPFAMLLPPSQQAAAAQCTQKISCSASWWSPCLRAQCPSAGWRPLMSRRMQVLGRMKRLFSPMGMSLSLREKVETFIIYLFYCNFLDILGTEESG